MQLALAICKSSLDITLKVHISCLSAQLLMGVSVLHLHSCGLGWWLKSEILAQGGGGGQRLAYHMQSIQCFT